MPPKDSSEFAAILAEMKALRKGLSGQLATLDKKVDGIASDVGDVRKVCRELFEAVLAQEIELARTKERVDSLELEFKLLKRVGNGTAPASPTEHS